MKIYVYISLLLLVVACSKEKEPDVVENPAPAAVTPPCTNNWVKPYEGSFKIRRRWPEFDSTVHFVRWTYDTVWYDCHLLYRDCNVLYYQEREISFPFDSTLESTVNLSTYWAWTDLITLRIDSLTDSIFITQEYGHNGRVYVFYSGYRE